MSSDLVTIWAAIAGIIAGALAALYGPFLKEWVETWAKKRKLRKGLYRELVRWHELAAWYIKDYNKNSENAFFKPEDFNVSPEASSMEPKIGKSILQSETLPQIGRIGRRNLQSKLEELHEKFSRLCMELSADNLYSKTLNNEDQLQLFYQLKECADIAECYEDFRYALDYQLTTYDSLPSSRFLTSEEAKELSLLDARLDWLNITYLEIEEAENSGRLDGCLLDEMRRGKRRGTSIRSTGETYESARWCLCCERYAEPVKRPYVEWVRSFFLTYDYYYRFLRSPIGFESVKDKQCMKHELLRKCVDWLCAQPVVYRALLTDLCKHCGAELPTIDELTKQLSLSSDEKRKQAAKAIAKIYKYNKSELKKDLNIEPLRQALEDPQQEVREAAAAALANIGKRLGNVRTAPSTHSDLKDEAVNSLITRLSHIKEEPSVRKEVIRAIGRIYYGAYDAGESRELLAQALKDDAVEVVETAVWAIGVIGDEKLFSSIQAMFKKPNFYTQDYAVAALEALGRFGRFGKDSVQLLIGVLRNDSNEADVRCKAANILGNIGDVCEVWEPLTRVAHDPLADPDVRAEAKRALVWLAPQYAERPHLP